MPCPLLLPSQRLVRRACDARCKAAVQSYRRDAMRGTCETRHDDVGDKRPSSSICTSVVFFR